MDYFAVTNTIPEHASEILRVNGVGNIEQYDIKKDKWRIADSGMCGIYTGDVEVEPISESRAKEIIKMWRRYVN